MQFFISNSVIQNHLPNNPYPSTVLANMSGVLLNSIPGLDYPKLLPPTYLEVGGFHIQKTKPLTKELNDFIESAGDEGLILFSLGFNFNIKYVPQDTFEAFIKVFGKLKQKVLIKADADLPYLPPNVKMMPFLPQADILGNKFTMLFLTLLGTISFQLITKRFYSYLIVESTV